MRRYIAGSIAGVIFAIALTVLAAEDYKGAQKLQGSEPRGTASTTYPVTVSGLNYDGGVTAIRVNADGTLVPSSTATSVTQGPAAWRIEGQDGGYTLPVQLLTGTASIGNIGTVGTLTDALPTGANTIGKVDQGAAAAASAAWPVNGSAKTSSAYGEVAILSTATAIPTTGLAGRRWILVQNNNGTNAIRCGMTSGVTTSTGISLAASGGAASFDCDDVACTVYCINVGGGNQTAGANPGTATNYIEGK